MVTQFNPATPNVMHIDLNSCFASVEQQANPLLRGNPLVVVSHSASYGAILAPSVEAKLYGVKTGMTVARALELCPFLIIREADPPKYRQVHAELSTLLSLYTPHLIPKSIDEFCLTLPNQPSRPGLEGLAHEIKSRIKREIGDYLRVSIGVSTNQILAKLASGLHKPDGLDIIDHTNALQIYGSITLTDFCGINIRNEARLHRVGIFTPLQFYESSLQKLTSAFESILARYWYARLRGYEVDDIAFARGSFGQSYVLPHSMAIGEWRPILAKLIAKAARRLRASGYLATGVGLALNFGDKTSWHATHKGHNPIFSDVDLLDMAMDLYNNRVTAEFKRRSVKKIAFTCFGLITADAQLNYLTDQVKQKALAHALDTLNDKWGEYTLTYGSLLGSAGHVRDAIAFGR